MGLIPVNSKVEKKGLKQIKPVVHPLTPSYHSATQMLIF